MTTSPGPRRGNRPIRLLCLLTSLLVVSLVTVSLLTVSLATAAPATGAQAALQAPRPEWAWPLDPVPRVVRPFDPPPAPWLPGHRGVDLAASPGQPVLAAGGGVVSFAGVVVDRGVVVVMHADGVRTTYEPVDAGLPRGSPVRTGDVIGVLGGGPSHCEPALCLHWGMRRGDVYLDPLLLVAPAGPPVLLPLDGPPNGIRGAGGGSSGDGGQFSLGRRDQRVASSPDVLPAARTQGRWLVPR